MGLGLEENQNYYVSVRAVNGAGLMATGASDGIVVDSKGPVVAASSPIDREIVNDAMPPIALPVSIRLGDGGGAGISWPSLAMVLDFSR